MSRKDNLRQTLEAHPHDHGGHGHGKSRDDGDGDEDEDSEDEEEDIAPWGKGAGGNGGNGDGGGNCCDSFAMRCVIHDNDPRVHYGGPWFLEGTELSTTHNTVVEGSNVSLIFNGSSIVVFGTVPASNQSEPPTVAYFLDTLPPSITTLPQATADISNQPLFSSHNLSSNDEHRLFINVTKIQSETPYALARFFISPVLPCSRSSQSSQATSPTTTSSTAPVSASPIFMPDHKTIIIVAGVLGSLVFLFIVAIIVFLIIRWRMYARRERFTGNPENSNRPETIYSAFTTTESILRNESGYSIWSQAPSHVLFNEASSRISRPCECSQPTGYNFLWPSDLARPREARLSAIKFASPPHSSSNSLSTPTSTLEN